MPNYELSHLWNGEVSGILNVAGLLVQLREGRVHALVLTASLAVLVWNLLLWRGAALRLTVHWRREHLQGKGEAEMTPSEAHEQ